METVDRVYAMQKFFQLTKVDEVTHRVSGIATNSKPDKEDERANYKATKKAYQTWSAEAENATKNSGQDVSLGNIRVQHTDQVGGKVVTIEYDDDSEEIRVETEPIDDNMFGQIKKGHYTGFSQGGDYAWRICTECGDTVPKAKGNYCASCKKVVGIEYGPVISEVSYVDNPCHGDAHFDLVKADGTHQMVKLRSASMEGQEQAAPELSQAQQTMIAGLVKSAVSEAIAELQPKLVKTTKETSEVVKTAIKAKLESAATDKAAKSEQTKTLIKNFIEEKVAERLPADLKKDMYGVARFAGMINDLAYLVWSTQYEAEMEQDGSKLPDDLQEDLENLVESFLAMAEEESSELTAATAERIGKVMKVTPTGLDKAYSKAAGIINKIKKAADDHHEAMTTASEEHCEKMKGHLDDLKECMGGAATSKVAKAIPKTKAGHQDTKSEIDDQEEGEIEDIDPSDDGTENIAEKTFTSKQVETMINKAVQQVVGALAKAEEEDDEEEEEEPEEKPAKKPAKKASPTSGIGSRIDEANSVRRGPVVKTMPVYKDDSPTGVTMVKADTSGEVDSKTVAAALQKGDTAAALTLMKSATPHNHVPSTLVAAVGSLGRSRR